MKRRSSRAILAMLLTAAFVFSNGITVFAMAGGSGEKPDTVAVETIPQAEETDGTTRPGDDPAPPAPDSIKGPAADDGETPETVPQAEPKEVVPPMAARAPFATPAGEWRVQNRNDANLAYDEDGWLTVRTESAGNNNDVKNVLYMEVDNEDQFELTVKTRGLSLARYNSAHVSVFIDNPWKDGVSAARRYHDYLFPNAPYRFGVLEGNGDLGRLEFYMEDPSHNTEEVYLKLVKDGADFMGYYSFSGQDDDWTLIEGYKSSTDGQLYTTFTSTAMREAAKLNIAFFATTGDTGNHTTFAFREFTYNGVEIPMVVENDAVAGISLEASPKGIDTIGGTSQMAVSSVTGLGRREALAINPVDFTFTSSDTSLATVDENGVVTAKGEGLVRINCEAILPTGTFSSYLYMAVGGYETDKEWQLDSPDGSTRFTVNLTDGRLSYSASQNGYPVLETAPIGIVTSLGDFSNNLIYTTETSTLIDETYTMLSGKQREYVNKANEHVLSFTQEDMEFDLVARVYDDGIAFRYLIRAVDGQELELQISDETTAFVLPTAATLTYMNRGSGQFNYEGLYQTAVVENIANSTNPSIPMLYQTTDDVWALITEAELSGAYVGSHVRKTGNSFKLAFDPTQSGPVQTQLPFQSPWRTAIIGTPADIVLNTMVENLSPAPDPKYNFEDWVNPGVSSWSWLDGYASAQADPEVHKKYIDLAAEMGWRYYMMDDNWQPRENPNAVGGTGYWGWEEEVTAYAAEKGVDMLAWVHYRYIDTHEKRMQLFEEYAALGIKGIKVDFFDEESQKLMQFYDGLYEDAAEWGLMLIIHGSHKPAGEIRTWPHVLTKEAIRGQEYHDIRTEQYTWIPFIRAAVGAADVTELVNPERDYVTMGFQLALSPLVENGLRSLASKSDVYLSGDVFTFYKDFPESWDETVYVGGTPGENVTLARRAGAEWYVGAIVVAEQRVAVDLSFLGAGNYTALVYHENGSRTAITMDQVAVTAADTLEYTVLDGGGLAIRIVPGTPQGIGEITVTTTQVTLNSLETAKIDYTLGPKGYLFRDIVWSVDDAAIAHVDASGTITALNTGTTKVRVSAAGNPLVSATVDVAVLPTEDFEPDRDTWAIFNENSNRVFNDENSVTINTEYGRFRSGGDASKNVIAVEAPGSDFEATVKVSGVASANFEGAFLMVFEDDPNAGDFVAVVRRYHTYLFANAPHRIGMMMEDKDGAEEEFYGPDTDPTEDVYLKLVKEGDTFTSYYSFNNQDWILVAGPFSQATSGTVYDKMVHAGLNVAPTMYIGVAATAGTGTGGRQVTISDFTLNGDPVPFAENNVCVEVLEGAITTANTALSSGSYIDDANMDALRALLSEATALAANATSIAAVADMVSRVLAAVDALTPVGDPAALLDIIADAEAAVASGVYEDDTALAALRTLLVEAAALAGQTASEAELTAMVQRVAAAMAALNRKVLDTVALQKKVQEAENVLLGINAGNYLLAGQQAFRDALTAAKATLLTATAQGEISTALQALESAMAALETLPSKGVLLALVQKTQALNAADYTADSFAALTSALTGALATLNDGQANGAAVNAAANALQAALDGLRAAPGGGTGGDSGAAAGTVATGDSNGNGLYILLALCAALAAASLLLVRRKRKSGKN